MSLAIALGLLLASAPADERTWAVVPVIVSGEGDGDRDRAREVLDRALRDRVGLRLASEDAFSTLGDRQLAERVRACGSDVDCVARALTEAGADQVLLAVLSFLSEPPLISLRVIDARAAKVLASDAAPLRADEGDPWAALGARANALLDRTGHPRLASLTVSVEPLDARVILADGTVQLGSTRFLLPPGVVGVRVERDGYRTETAAVTLTAGEDTALRVALIQEQLASPSLLESPWFWIAAGAGVALAAGTAIVLIGDASTCVCVVRNGTDCRGC